VSEKPTRKKVGFVVLWRWRSLPPAVIHRRQDRQCHGFQCPLDAKEAYSSAGTPPIAREHDFLQTLASSCWGHGSRFVDIPDRKRGADLEIVWDVEFGAGTLRIESTREMSTKTQRRRLDRQIRRGCARIVQREPVWLSVMTEGFLAGRLENWFGLNLARICS